MNFNIDEDEFNKHDYTIDLIDMDELSILLNYESEKSVKNWCRKNKIEIYKTGHRKHIMRYDYERVIKMPQIIYFRKEYGDNWEYAFKLAQNNELYKMDINNEPISFHSGTYKPKSKAAEKIK